MVCLIAKLPAERAGRWSLEERVPTSILGMYRGAFWRKQKKPVAGYCQMIQNNDSVSSKQF